MAKSKGVRLRMLAYLRFKISSQSAGLVATLYIQAKTPKQGLRVKFEFEINFAFAHLILFAMERVYAENDKNAEKI